VAKPVSGSSPSDSIDATTWNLRLPLAVLLRDERLERLIGLPVSVVARVGSEPASATIECPRRGGPEVRCGQSVFELVEDEDAFLGRAGANEARPAIEQLVEDNPGIEADLTIEVANDPESSGVRWIRTAEALRVGLRESWLATLEEVFKRGTTERLVVADGGDAGVWTPCLQVCGPAASPRPLANPELPEVPSRWWREHRADGRSLPVPAGLIPTDRDGDSLGNLDRLLTDAARALVWLWLAAKVSSPELGQPVEVTFEGERVAQAKLEVSGANHASDELLLWDWAMEDADPARFDAIQRAVALAVFRDKDFERAARPARRTAKTLFQVLRENELSEAMATRRTVRDAAVGAGRAAADAGRAAGAKSLERVLVQAAAAAGILIANSGDAISTTTTVLLLSLVGALLAASATIALASDYPAAFGILDSFEEDLDLYGDTLSDGDIADIKKMASLADARRRITASLTITVVVLVLAATALIVALVAV